MENWSDEKLEQRGMEKERIEECLPDEARMGVGGLKEVCLL